MLFMLDPMILENVDGITESSCKNCIYCLMPNVMKFEKFWMDNQVSVNIKPQKDCLNMNPACSVYVCFTCSTHYMKTNTSTTSPELL